MTIHQRKDIILVWLRSCLTHEQVEELRKGIQEYWLKQFEKEVKRMKRRDRRAGRTEYLLVQNELLDAIGDQKMLCVQNAKPHETGVPTLDRQDKY